MIKLKCNDCPKIYVYEDNKLECKCVASRGIENEYEGTLRFYCDNCNNNFIAQFLFWEYPAQTLSYSEYKEEGCIVLQEPDYQAYFTTEANGQIQSSERQGEKDGNDHGRHRTFP